MPELKRHPTPLDINAYPDDFSPCHRRVLSARAIPKEQLHKPLSALIPVEYLRDAKRAGEHLYHALQTQQKIVIVGDYDADGATAMSVVVAVLRHLRADYDTVVPNRVTMGYGLSKKAVEEVLTKRATLVITVDNGISAVDSVATLKAHGVEVIITDHHLPPETLPDAEVIVNPNRRDCEFPSKALAGVGVAFYVMLALRQVFREHGDTRLDHFVLADLLPFVAIGTVADVVPLDFNNRVLVEQGLKRIRTAQCAQGITALIKVAGLNQAHVTATDIGFQIAPRLNAAGRIADMQLGVDCLLSDNARLAIDYAIELNRLNHERRTMENEMRVQADKLLTKQAIDDHAVSICLFDADWNEGLIGILAARLKDSYGKTAFVFTEGANGELKASARAAPAVNLIEALTVFNRDNPHVLSNYGGHTKAAGFILSPMLLPTFATGIAQVIAEQLANKTIDDALYTDGELLPYELNIANAEFLRTLEPWGSELPEPLFENIFYLDQIREVGKNHAQLAMIESQSGRVFKGIAFNQFTQCDELIKSHCRVAYRLNINEWRGQRSLSLQVEYMEKR